MNCRSLVDMFVQRVRANGDLPALWRPVDNHFTSQTWREFHADVCRLTATFVQLKVQPGDRIAHLSENRAEWLATDLAILGVGAIHVPIHAPLTGPQVAYQVRHCGARIVVVSNASQFSKLQGSDLPADLVFVSYDEVDSSQSRWPVQRLSSLLSNARFEDGSQRFEETAQRLGFADVATILYTSGTTGEPKGVVLTHGNLVTNTLSTLSTLGNPPGVRRLNFLPLSHIFARTCDLYAWIAGGSELAVARSRESVLADCAIVKPTWINGVPYFYEKVWRALRDAGVADKPGSLRAILGGQIVNCCAGGAALPPHLFDYFFSQGVPLLEGYGLSETSPVISISTPDAVRRQCVGRPIPDVEVQISNEGEILTRGPHVMPGYYRDEAATKEVLIDGWFHTGDLGSIDSDGFLRITGRKKELIVTSGGKNVAPVLLESLLTEDPLILQAMVVGDNRSYLTALIFPNWDLLAAKLPAGGEFELGALAPDHPQIQTVIEQVVRDRLRDVAPFEQVRRFTLLQRPFTIEAGELTPKLSLRRQQIAANFAREIEAMYAAPSKCHSSTDQL